MKKKPKPKPVSFKVSKEVKKALQQMKAEGRKVRVVGDVRQGRLHVDLADIAEFTKKHPDSTISFVALNAPFKTKGVSASV